MKKVGISSFLHIVLSHSLSIIFLDEKKMNDLKSLLYKDGHSRHRI